MNAPIPTAIAVLECPACQGKLEFVPGTEKLSCRHCGVPIAIPQSESVSIPAAKQEIDLAEFLSENNVSEDATHQVHTVRCTSCGAEATLRPNVSAEKCAFCDTPLVIQNQHTRNLIKPKHILPFKVKLDEAQHAFRQWISGLWFAPNAVKFAATRNEPLSGMYIPYWTYDASTFSTYTGQRGTNHTVHYTVNVNGRSESRTRTEIRWSSVSGRVSRDFDDVLVLASKSLPPKQTQALEPWDLHQLVDYDDRYLAGFRAETYQVGLKDGFVDAQGMMAGVIHSDICRDIGGDHQRVGTVDTRYSDVTFKHILLPVWVSAYRHADNVYRFVVNARTGEVQGERPWSWVKISLAVGLGLLAVGLVALLSNRS